MGDQIVPCTYFDKPGEENSAAVFRIAGERAKALGTHTILVASTTGATGAKVAVFFGEYDLVVVTHAYGFRAIPGNQDLQPKYRADIEAAGARILTCPEPFCSVGWAVHKKVGGCDVEEVIACVYRTFGEGVKVAVEITLMASDAGLVGPGQEVIAIAGTHRGADTAIVALPAHTRNFLALLEIREILCRPRSLRTPAEPEPATGRGNKA
jgi:hypothetical protein